MGNQLGIPHKSGYRRLQFRELGRNRQPDKIRIVLACRVKPPEEAKDWGDKKLIDWINCQVDGAPDLMVRRSVVAEAAEFMRRHSQFATEDGQGIIDDDALASLPEHGVPAFLLPLLYIADEEEVEQAMKESAGSGAADAQESGEDGAQKSAVERLVEMGMAQMAQVPAACLEGEDPMAPLDRVLEKVAAVDKKPSPEDPDAPDKDGTNLLREVGEALSSVERAAEMLDPGPGSVSRKTVRCAPVSL